MRIAAAVGAGALFVTVLVHGQTASSWPCSSELTKSEGDNHRIRISAGVSEALIRRRFLPDVSDLKHTKTNSTVIVRTLVGKDGIVRCTDAVQGDTELYERSIDAAKQWQFAPFLLNGQPLIFETPIEFVFKKGKVTAR